MCRVEWSENSSASFLGNIAKRESTRASHWAQRNPLQPASNPETETVFPTRVYLYSFTYTMTLFFSFHTTARARELLLMQFRTEKFAA